MVDTAIAVKVATFFDGYRTRAYTKGQVIVFSGEKPTHVYYVVAGKAKVYDVGENGDEAVLTVFSEGSFFPMSFIMNDTECPFIIEAETDMVVRVAPGQEVLAFLRQNNDVLYDLLARVYSGTDGMLGRLSHLMSGSARSRLLYELIIEAKRFGKETAAGIELSLLEKDLGARAGLSRETVSREMHKLKAAEVVVVKNKAITISSIAALQALLDKES